MCRAGTRPSQSKRGGSRIGSRGGSSRSTPPKGLEQFVDRRPKALGRRISPTDRLAEDQSHFLFHGPAVVGRALAQISLHVVVEIADRYARHRHAFNSRLIEPYAVLAMQSGTVKLYISVQFDTILSETLNQLNRILVCPRRCL